MWPLSGKHVSTRLYIDTSNHLSRLVATLGSKSTLKKVDRKEICAVNIPKACQTIVSPEAPMALRLQSNLLLVTTVPQLDAQAITDMRQSDTESHVYTANNVISSSKMHRSSRTKYALYCAHYMPHPLNSTASTKPSILFLFFSKSTEVSKLTWL